MIRPQVIAWHESGHCAVSLALGWPPWWVSTDEDHPCCQLDPAMPADLLAPVLAAGYVAEDMQGWPASPRGWDLAQLARLVAEFPLLSLADAYAIARRLLTAHRARQARLAAALMRHGWLDGFAVAALWQGCAGLPAIDDLDSSMIIRPATPARSRFRVGDRPRRPPGHTGGEL